MDRPYVVLSRSGRTVPRVQRRDYARDALLAAISALEDAETEQVEIWFIDRRRRVLVHSDQEIKAMIFRAESEGAPSMAPQFAT